MDTTEKIKGRKRNLLVDTDGRVLEGVVSAAGLKALLGSYGASRVP